MALPREEIETPNKVRQLQRTLYRPAASVEEAECRQSVEPGVGDTVDQSGAMGRRNDSRWTLMARRSAVSAVRT